MASSPSSDPPPPTSSSSGPATAPKRATPLSHVTSSLYDPQPDPYRFSADGHQHHHYHHHHAHHGHRTRSPSPHHNPHRAHKHHPFPYAASSSVADLSLAGLTDLVDSRSGWYEEKRMTEEAIEEQCKGKPRKIKAALRSYYADLNYVLDGWRTADVILDSQFPAEVLRRFGTMQEVEEALGRAAKYEKHPGVGVSRRIDMLGGRTTSHTGLMHLLANGTPEGGRSPAYVATSSDDDDSPRAPHRARRGRRAHRPSVLGDEESHGVGTRRFPEGDVRNSFGTRAANAFGLGWLRYSEATPPPSTPPPLPPSSLSKKSSTTITQPPPLKPQRTASEDESGFDSDSEPEPSEAGPRPRQSQNQGERRRLLEGQERRERGRPKSKSTGQYGGMGQTQTQTQAQNGGGNSVPTHVVVRATTPAGREIAAIEGPEGSEEGSLDRRLKDQQQLRDARDQAKAAVTVGANNASSATTPPDTDEDRDQLADLPGGRRERDRQALRKAVPGWEEREEGEERSVQFAINLNLLINILLLLGKAVAVLSSSSVSLLASLVDSALDLLSTIIIFAASKFVAFKSTASYFKYPRGKKNFEPLGVVIFSVLMIASFCQVLVESCGRFWTVVQTGRDPEAGKDGQPASLPLLGVGFMLATIGIKTVMWLLYRHSHSSGVRAVAQDSQNDVVFNIFSLTFPFLGSWLKMPALDPIGGIVLSLYIISEWLGTLVETTTKLSGARASTQELARILYLVVRFRSVQFVSSCEVYHTGDDLTVEMDIILPVSMPLKEAHDLGEITTYATESLPSVSRCFTHLDYYFGPATHLRGPF
ncbi:hypothetical protein BDZ90DRAFT_281267 [Jaminaea rosea]|uniref:Cation efflux protein transmembrane domain-containing protein n=1 Tax=Jaminaea rosea TaxID=1569628 RepID=A0A316UKW7_9BASI|nr:hypothetical protein BDZ90DRAFT_281267 [Jaminaea rosea]PWN25879.1 hypothetical protein BDZ90DRAFT_281267 [Jaminaea rosea]